MLLVYWCILLYLVYFIPINTVSTSYSGQYMPNISEKVYLSQIEVFLKKAFFHHPK